MTSINCHQNSPLNDLVLWRLNDSEGLARGRTVKMVTELNIFDTIKIYTRYWVPMNRFDYALRLCHSDSFIDTMMHVHACDVCFAHFVIVFRQINSTNVLAFFSRPFHYFECSTRNEMHRCDHATTRDKPNACMTSDCCSCCSNVNHLTYLFCLALICVCLIIFNS